jgi:hypothetical protein
MKLWQSILITLLIIFAFILIPSGEKLIPYVFLISAIWAAADSSNKEINKYKPFLLATPAM